MLMTVRQAMTDYPARWWIAGGWAIDLFLKRQSRTHADIDIAVLRRDQQSLRKHFAGWRLSKVVNSHRKPWLDGENLELPIHQIYADNGSECLEFLLNEATGNLWQYRRNEAIVAELQRITCVSETGLPYLCPEVVLLYKAKSMRDQDRADFANVVGKLASNAIDWLTNALQICHSSHPWIDELRR